MTANKIKINKLCEITSSKRIFASEYQTSGVPFYRGKEISAKQKSSSEVDDPIFITHEKYLDIKSKYGVPVGGDLLLTSVGTIGNPYLVKNGEEFYFKDGNLTWFRKFNGLNSQWLYYWLLSPQGKFELNKCTIGSSQKAYTINLLEGLEIELPEISTQADVALVLNNYDQLIENNEKRIRILEEMSRRLYEEWFVKFNFPDHEKVKMVDSGTEFGMIPEEWKIDNLGGVIELVYGKALKAENRMTGDVVVCGSGGVVGTHNKKMSSAPGIVIGRKGNAGAVYWVNDDFYVIDTAYFVKTDLPISFVYHLLKNQKFVLGDAAVPGLNREQAYRNRVLIPPQKLIEMFAEKSTDLKVLCGVVEKENNKLSAIRDLLIPQLVTRKREVKGSG